MGKENMSSDQLRTMGFVEDPNNPGQFIRAKDRAKTGDRGVNLMFNSPTIISPTIAESDAVDDRYFKGLNNDQICQQYKGGKNGLYIPYDVPSMKNRKQLFVRQTKEGKNVPGSTNNQVVKDYKLVTKMYYENYRMLFLAMVGQAKFPIRVQFFFIRRSAQQFDYNNIGQMVQDLMVEYNWLPDDSAKYLIPNFDAGYALDKFNPGVIIRVL